MITTRDLARHPFFKLIRPLLKTKIGWKLTGISLTTSLLSTKGYTSFDQYIRDCNDFALKSRRYLKQSDILLDFCCGIGGYAFEVSNFCEKVYGIDINKGYVKIAKKLYGIKSKKLEFHNYDGKNLPFEENFFDLVYAHAVFERIPKSMVKNYLNQFSYILKPEKTLLVDFLRENATKTGFTELLGSDSYVFWQKDEVIEIMNHLKFRIASLAKTPTKFVVVVTNEKVRK